MIREKSALGKQGLRRDGEPSTAAAKSPPEAERFRVPAGLTTKGENRMAQVLLSVVCNQLILGAVAYAAYRVLMGDSASIGGSLAHGMSRLASLVGAALLVGLSGGIIMVLARITGPIIGLVLLVVLAMLMCMWSVVVPACVVERLGPVESLNRSMELTRDCRLKIFGLTLLVGIASRLIERAAGSVAGSTASGSILLSLVLLFVYAIPQTFGNVMPAIIYYDLRAAKEGVTLESLADVFD